MEILTIYDKLLPVIKNIPKHKININICMPVEIYIQEAYALFHYCRADKNELIIKGLDWEIAASIPDRAAALRTAYMNYQAICNERKLASDRFMLQLQELKKVHSSIMSDFRFALRGKVVKLKNKQQGKRIQATSAVVQSIYNLYGLSLKYPKELQKIHFDYPKLAKAMESAEQLAKFAADKKAKTDYNIAKKIRDQALTYLKWAVDEVYNTGRYVFRGNPAKRYGYASAYLRKRRLQKRRKKSMNIADIKPIIEK